jgi:hypothetical protein
VGFRLINETQQVVLTYIEKDTLPHYENITVKEEFQLGHGNLCFIHDQMVRPINQMLKNQKPPEPASKIEESITNFFTSQIFSEIRAKPK